MAQIKPLDPDSTEEFQTNLGLLSFRILFGGVGLIPPATALNYIPWAMVGFVFQYLIRRRRFSFWAKYNCTFEHFIVPWAASADLWTYADVLSAALDAGTAISVVLIFFWWVLAWFIMHEVAQDSRSLQYPLNGSIGANSIQKWWGNTVYQKTVDWNQRPLVELAKGAKFGYVINQPSSEHR